MNNFNFGKKAVFFLWLIVFFDFICFLLWWQYGYIYNAYQHKQINTDLFSILLFLCSFFMFLFLKHRMYCALIGMLVVDSFLFFRHIHEVLLDWKGLALFINSYFNLIVIFVFYYYKKWWGKEPVDAVKEGSTDS